MENKPRGREKHITGQGKDIYKRGEGLGTGPVGKSGGYQGRPGTTSASAGSGGQTQRASGSRSPLAIIIVLAVVLLGGGGAGLSSLLGGGGTAVDTELPQSYTAPAQTVTTQSPVLQPSGSASSGTAAPKPASSGQSLSSIVSGFGNVSTGWNGGSNLRQLNSAVAPGARDKRTEILGGGRDTVTIMVYMCGTDLESRSCMGTYDLQEMLGATLSDKVNLIVYTGGCKQWRNNVVSNSVNQIYKIENGRMVCLEKDMGTASMVKPSTLTEFIKYCARNYPANRNELIFWDHGGGSLSGYGYDEKNPRAGSMTLKGINEALSAAGMSFDFIGFDACLMATLENALMLTDYADYMIASEETEPGVGWYYTNWLTRLSQNTSMTTLELGKNIVDDFVSVCNQKCAGQKTTLSVVDLAELEATAPEALKAFASSTSELMQNGQYQAVSNARSGAREFASSNRIDQVDLVHLAYKLNTEESRQLCDTLISAVKYNNTSSSITNAYGLSIYFPYQTAAKVDSAVASYEAIGMDSEYTQCIREFASMGVGGQAVASGGTLSLDSLLSSGSASPLDSLLGSGSSSGSGSLGADMIGQVLSGLLSGSSGGSFFGRSMDLDSMSEYLSENRFDAGQLVWLGSEPSIRLSEEQWGLVNDLALNVFYDDGAGFIDLGLDNSFSVSDDGALSGAWSGTWLAIDGQPVAYYHTGTVYDGDSYTITGRVPVLLNGERADLLLVFDNANPYGYIAGARRDYRAGETETVSKSETELAEGDEIDFVCDYYSYEGVYQDSYMLGDPWVYHADAEISDVSINADRANATYLFTDIYGQEYWTPVIP